MARCLLPALVTCGACLPQAFTPSPPLLPRHAPPPAAQVWEAAQQQGLRSKRYTKLMLNELRTAGFVKTQPLGGPKKHKSFGYRLNEEEQKKRAARLQRKAEGGGGGAAAGP